MRTSLLFSFAALLGACNEHFPNGSLYISDSGAIMDAARLDPCLINKNNSLEYATCITRAAKKDLDFGLCDAYLPSTNYFCDFYFCYAETALELGRRTRDPARCSAVPPNNWNLEETCEEATRIPPNTIWSLICPLPDSGF